MKGSVRSVDPVRPYKRPPFFLINIYEAQYPDFGILGFLF